MRGRRVCYSEVQGSGLRVIRGGGSGGGSGGRFRGGGSGLMVEVQGSGFEEGG